MRDRLRFPRTNSKGDTEDIIWLHEVRRQWPLPEYDPHRDGSYNPGDMVLDHLLRLPKDKLRQFCSKHGLLNTGDRKALMTRMYRHWKASKMGLGFPRYGYGEDFEMIREPECSCGVKTGKTARVLRFIRTYSRFPRTHHWPRMVRYPRTKRFPRLPYSFDFEPFVWSED